MQEKERTLILHPLILPPISIPPVLPLDVGIGDIFVPVGDMTIGAEVGIDIESMILRLQVIGY